MTQKNLKAVLLVLFFCKSLCYPLSASVQFSSVAQPCPTPCNPMNCSTPGLSAHHHLPEFTQTQVHRVHDAIQPSHPRSPPSPPAPISPSIRVFSNESILCMRWSKYWSFSFSIIPSREIPGLLQNGLVGSVFRQQIFMCLL